MPGETQKTLKEKKWGKYAGPSKSKPTVSKESTGRSAAIQKGIAENWQKGQDKKAAADAARADIIKRSQTGNVDREDYRGGRHKYGMSVDDYHNMMGTVPQKKYGEMFPYSAGIPQLLSKVFSKFPGINMAGNIMRSIQGSDLGTMTGDLIGNPLKNLYQNIKGSDLGTMTGDIKNLITGSDLGTMTKDIKNLVTGNQATNPDAVSIVDNNWITKKENKPENLDWWDVDATTADENRMISPMDQGLAEYYNQLKMQGPQGEEIIDDFSETIEDVPAAYAQFPDQGNTGFPWKMSESGHQLDPALNPGLDLSSYGDPGIESWTPAKEQKLNALLAQLMQGYDNGVGSLTEPNIDALKAQIMGNPVTPNFGDLSELYGINANAFNPEAYIQEQMALGNPPNINTGLFNRGGIASLQYGGQPGPFSDPTTVTEEETYDIQPLQMDPGIMGIGDLEDLFEEAKVKESIYDKLKYVNNTMHG